MDTFFPALFLSLFIFIFLFPILCIMYNDTSDGDNRAGTIKFAALMFALTFAMSGAEISRHKEIKTATNSTTSDIVEEVLNQSTTAASKDKHAPGDKEIEKKDESSNVLIDLSVLYTLGFL